jgi:hypothetical protein
MIPQHTSLESLSQVRTINVIRAILIMSKFVHIREESGPQRTTIFYAEYLLEKGRIHFKAKIDGGHYVIDIHYDSEQHLRKPRRLTYGKSKTIVDNWEVRQFINQFILPTILANRKLYHYRMHNGDKWRIKAGLLNAE